MVDVIALLMSSHLEKVGHAACGQVGTLIQPTPASHIGAAPSFLGVAWSDKDTTLFAVFFMTVAAVYEVFGNLCYSIEPVTC